MTPRNMNLPGKLFPWKNINHEIKNRIYRSQSITLEVKSTKRNYHKENWVKKTTFELSITTNNFMKRITQLLTALVFCSLMIFISCGGKKDKDDPDPLDEVGTALLKTWTVTSATYNNTTRSEWNDAGFTITVTNYNSENNSGTISYSNIPDSDGYEDAAGVWGSPGTWTFGTSTSRPYTIVRPDDIIMSATFDAENPTSLTLSFTVDASTNTGRTSGFDGSWVFVFN